jgi:signal peptidase II
MADPSPRSEDTKAATPTTSVGFWNRLYRNLFRDKIFFWTMVCVLVALDLWTKHAILSLVKESPDLLDHGGPVIWISEPWLGLVEVFNRGGVFGVGSGLEGIGRIVFMTVRFAALGVILYLLATTPRKARGHMTALAMIMGGALGNIWDTIRIGAVRDFLYVDLDAWPADPWPAFNVADSLILVGVFALALLLHLDWRKTKKSKAA